MSKARIIHELHDDFGVTLSEAEKAYDIAVEYIRLRSAIGDHPEDYEPSEYILVKASEQSTLGQVQAESMAELIRCKYCKFYDGRPCGIVDYYNTANDFCSRAKRRTNE